MCLNKCGWSLKPQIALNTCRTTLGSHGRSTVLFRQRTLDWIEQVVGFRDRRQGLSEQAETTDKTFACFLCRAGRSLSRFVRSITRSERSSSTRSPTRQPVYSIREKIADARMSLVSSISRSSFLTWVRSNPLGARAVLFNSLTGFAGLAARCPCSASQPKKRRMVTKLRLTVATAWLRSRRR